jgi:hypothetical protein
MTSGFCFECGRDLPGDHVSWCSIYAPTPIDYTEPTRLARNVAPVTSKHAAATLTHDLTDHYRAVLDWLAEHGPATDEQIAQAMVDADLTPRTETARRWVRTLREEHDQIEPPPVPSNAANLTPWTKSNFLAVSSEPLQSLAMRRI